MSLTAGTLTLVSTTSTSVSVSSTAATGGTGPYTEAWYISTTSGFSPGGGNIVSGASGLAATITGLIPNTSYYVKVVYTDTGNGNTTVNSSQLAVTTNATTLNPNQFAQSPVVGMIDLQFDYDTVSVIIDPSQATNLYAGMAVKITQTSLNGPPMVIGCAADTDNVFGFINFDIKTVAYQAGYRAEISQAGNVMYLYSTGAITRGDQVTLDLTTGGGVADATGSNNIVGWAFDGAAAAGTLIRVKLSCPSFTAN